MLWRVSSAALHELPEFLETLRGSYFVEAVGNLVRQELAGIYQTREEIFQQVELVGGDHVEYFLPKEVHAVVNVDHALGRFLLAVLLDKIALDNGVATIKGKKVIILRFLQGRNPDWVGKPFCAEYDEKAIWLDDLKPAFEEKFFFEDEFKTKYKIQKDL